MDTKAKPYKRIQHIGSGASGQCYLCVNSSGQYVVLKKLKYDEKAVYEARILSKIKHSYIVNMGDAHRSERSMYLVLEYMAGGTLEAYIYANPTCKMPDVVIHRFSLQITEALAYIHSLVVIHRDVKPANLMLSADQGVVKLGDFGSAILLRPHARVKGRFGTCNYTAPEVLNGTEYGTCVDMWSLGCVISEMVDQKRLFDARNASAVCVKIVERNFTLNNSSIFWPLMSRLMTDSMTQRLSAAETLAMLQDIHP